MKKPGLKGEEGRGRDGGACMYLLIEAAEVAEGLNHPAGSPPGDVR